MLKSRELLEFAGWPGSDSQVEILPYGIKVIYSVYALWEVQAQLTTI